METREAARAQDRQLKGLYHIGRLLDVENNGLLPAVGVVKHRSVWFIRGQTHRLDRNAQVSLQCAAAVSRHAAHLVAPHVSLGAFDLDHLCAVVS